MATTTLSSVLGILAQTVRSHHGKAQSLEAGRLDRHALDDLNLPPDFRARLELNRDPSHWDRLAGWRTL